MSVNDDGCCQVSFDRVSSTISRSQRDGPIKPIVNVGLGAASSVLRQDYARPRQKSRY